MKSIKQISIALMMVASLLSTQSCAEFDFDDIEPITNQTNLTANTTIAELKALYPGSLYQITNSSIAGRDSIIIEGIVTSDDKDGNFYKSLFIQDATSAIEIKLGKTGLYNDYKRGQKIVVLCTDLYLGDYGGQIQLGSIYSNSGVWEIGALEGDVIINMHVFKQGNELNEVTPMDMTPTLLTQPNIGKLVKFNNVQIADITSPITGETYTYADAENDVTINLGLISNVYTYTTGDIVLRTSGYAKFAGTTIATGSGSITGILTYYNGTYQLIIRDLDDVELTEPRFQM